jgi:hypothetical protein
MSSLLLPALLLSAMVHGADNPPKSNTAKPQVTDETPRASGKLDGKRVTYSSDTIAEGVKATTALLESCHDCSDNSVRYTAADLKKAQEGDYIHLLFAKPITVKVCDHEIKVTELVLTQPLNTGVFWLRSGSTFWRCSKYQVEKEKPFLAWRGQAQLED